MHSINVTQLGAPAFFVSLGDDGEFRFDGVNDVICRLTGLGPEKVIGRKVRECLSPVVARQVETQYRHCIETRAGYEYEQHLVLPGGAKWWRTTLSPVIDPSTGEVRGVFGLTIDVTDRKLAELELRSAAFKDPLTGICNRRRFERDLANAVAAAAETGRRFAVLLADVDRFKPINDEHGHGAGDAVLKQIAERLARGIHDNDRLARIGGDEFAAILSAPTDEAVDVSMARLKESLAGPILLFGRSFDVGISLGTALWKAGMTSADVLAQADRAMYEAKRQRAS